MAMLRILRKFPILCEKGMSEPITGRHWRIELVLELNIIGILRVLFFLVAEKLRIKVWFIVRWWVVFVLLHVVMAGNWERRDVSWVMVVNIDSVDVLLDGLPWEIVCLRLIWPFRCSLLPLGRLLTLEQVDAGLGLSYLSRLLIWTPLCLLIHPQSYKLDLLIDLLEFFHLHRA